MAKYGVWRPVLGQRHEGQPGDGWVRISMPYAPNNRAWLKEVLGERIRPEWDKKGKRWWVARNHFGAVVEALAQRLGYIDVYVDFRGVERCDTRCKNARSRECDCQCLGKYHGQGGITHGWKLVGDTTEVLSTDIKRRHFVVVREGRGENA
jgi:hypothetical protein